MREKISRSGMGVECGGKGRKSAPRKINPREKPHPSKSRVRHPNKKTNPKTERKPEDTAWGLFFGVEEFYG
jgi:hypothetical protein